MSQNLRNARGNIVVAPLLLVARPGAPSSFLFLVAMPGAPSSVLAPSLAVSALRKLLSIAPVCQAFMLWQHALKVVGQYAQAKL